VELIDSCLCELAYLAMLIPPYWTGSDQIVDGSCLATKKAVSRQSLRLCDSDAETGATLPGRRTQILVVLEKTLCYGRKKLWPKISNKSPELNLL
jgi:hypothetical protein